MDVTDSLNSAYGARAGGYGINPYADRVATRPATRDQKPQPKSPFKNEVIDLADQGGGVWVEIAQGASASSEVGPPQLVNKPNETYKTGTYDRNAKTRSGDAVKGMFVDLFG